MIADSPKTRNRHRSTMPTSTPAGTANRNIGRLFATCTIEARNGSESRLVMSQPETSLIYTRRRLLKKLKLSGSYETPADVLRR